ncbi:PREDICTED: uncharacterized protein LOC104599293 [Nelumbo nucifera]|uniref:Uncharacterized protein LOC104599293 n=2 Tax=Nelumbo nucifera TaxID=4432 RepID=A0A1U8A1K3_NELNU|nr:PREDICTED: uncharacterized protein LOC104599293 [Nelumbo nucifera]XP_010260079.2 PREDICTED: uncharacterized protein LOC104599293 [Nelumbo nucifera]DAD35049.1 TPA_asm: hypothetical protein HUJ06_005689 [Nelumbo nucifera]
MESGHGNTEDTVREVRIQRSSSLSSSSSDSSLDEQFEVDRNLIGESNPVNDEVAQFAFKDAERNASSISSPKFGESEKGMPGFTYRPQLSSTTLDLGLDNGLSKQSPPVQTMDRYDVPDPYRIPASVFERSKSTTPLEWSVASNESLFSIHVGNNSFSRDHVYLFGRSGELTLSGELTKSGELKMLQSSSPPANIPSLSPHKDTDLGDSLGVAEAAAETMKEVLRTTAEDKEKNPPVDVVRQSSSTSRRSDASATSIQSFAFPILTGEGGGRSGSVKADPEQNQQPQSQTPGATPDAAQNKWFPCFSCCPFCC